MPHTETTFDHDEQLLEELLLVYQKAVRVTRTDEAARTILECYTNAKIAMESMALHGEFLDQDGPENG